MVACVQIYAHICVLLFVNVHEQVFVFVSTLPTHCHLLYCTHSVVIVGLQLSVLLMFMTDSIDYENTQTHSSSEQIQLVLCFWDDE